MLAVSSYGCGNIESEAEENRGQETQEAVVWRGETANLKVSSTFVLHLKKNFQALADLEDYLQSDKEDVHVK